MCFATIAYVNAACPVRVTIYSIGGKLSILWSYTLLLKLLQEAIISFKMESLGNVAITSVKFSTSNYPVCK